MTISSRVLTALLLVAPFCVADSAMAQTIQSADELVASLRTELATSCGTLEFGEGFATRHNMNGDGIDDLLIDYHALSCDDSSALFCGSGGCDMILYLGRREGGFAEIASFFGYVIEFDRPDDSPPSFVVALHGNECGVSGMEPCSIRYKIDGGNAVEVGEVPSNPADR